MEQVQPGIYHWIGHDAEVRSPVHSYYVEPAGALIDPVAPDDGMEAFESLEVRPQQVLLTNRRHQRQADGFREAFGCVVRVGSGALRDGEVAGAEPFDDGDEVAWGITAIVVGHALPEETLFHVSHGEGAAVFGDTLTRPPDGPIALPSDDLIAAAHPDRKRRRYKEAFRGLLLRDFDVLLLAHGAPVSNGGKAALRKLVEEPTEYPEFGPYA